MSKVYSVIPLMLSGKFMFIDMSAYLRREACGCAEYTSLTQVNWDYPEDCTEEEKNAIDIYMGNVDLEQVDWSVA